MNLGIILIFAALATPSPSPAPTKSLAADPCGGVTTNLLAALNRPTIGFSACAVKLHESVWELGYNNQSQMGSSRIITYPQGFIRFGLARGLEFDLIGPAYQLQRSGATTQSGFLDSGMGMKYQFFADSATVMAADFLYIAPTGASAFTAGAPIATFNFDYARTLSPSLGFATTIGVQSSYAQNLGGRSARFASLLPSAVLTAQTSSRMQFYGEVYGQTRIRPDGGALYGLDGGVQYLLAPQMEIDAEAGQTVTDLVRAHYYGIGLGLRF